MEPPRSKEKWILSAVLVQVTALFLAVALMVGIFRLIRFAASAEVGGVSWESLGLQVAWKIIGLAFLFFTIYTVHRRKKIGRFLCLVYVTAVVAVAARQFILRNPATSSADAVGVLIALVPFVYWLYAVGLSSKAKAYFHATNRN